MLNSKIENKNYNVTVRALKYYTLSQFRLEPFQMNEREGTGTQALSIPQSVFKVCLVVNKHNGGRDVKGGVKGKKWKEK